MCLLGYNPRKYHTGRAPLEAASIGVPMGPSDWIFRLNLVTVGEHGMADDGMMLDHSAGAITDAEARVLVSDLLKHWQRRAPGLAEKLDLTHGVSYRSILVDRSGEFLGPKSATYNDVTCTPPHEIPRQPWASHMPTAIASPKSGTVAQARSAAERLRLLMNLATEILPDHPINEKRRQLGKRVANLAWIWGQGQRPSLPLFADRFHLTGAMTTAVDLLAGIASLIGWQKLHVDGVTSYHDNNYAGQAAATVEALDKYDVVCCHVEAPDELSHQGDWKTKVASIEAIDRLVVAPILAKLRSFGDPASDPKAQGWRLLVLPDHYTLVSTRKHDATPVPFVMGGSWIKPTRPATFCERNCDGSDLHISRGDELMEYFLKSGLR